MVGGVPSSKLNLWENTDISHWPRPRCPEGVAQHLVSRATSPASLSPRRTPVWYPRSSLSAREDGPSRPRGGQCAQGRWVSASGGTEYGTWGVPGPDPREAETGHAAEYLLAAEELHSQKCEDDDEQEEEEQQADDGFHGVEERDDQVPERRPVPANRGRRWGGGSGWARAAVAEPACPPPRCPSPSSPKTYFVTLKIRNNLRARNTLIPKDVPGFMTAQMTSKMLPMMT